MKPCNACVEAGVYDASRNPHGSRRSGGCPFHAQNIDEYLKTFLGGPFDRYCIKNGIDSVLMQDPRNFIFLNTKTHLTDSLPLFRDATLAHFNNNSTPSLTKRSYNA